MLPDAELMLRTWLTAKVTARVETIVPNPLPAEFVRVWRTGGPSSSRVVDNPQVTVQAWSSSKAGAAALIGQVRSLFHAAATRTELPLVRRVVEMGGPYYDPDPTTGAERYSLSVSMRVRATRA